jgi:hypothetical protein
MVKLRALMAITCPFLAVSAGANDVVQVTNEERKAFDVLRKAIQSQPGGY